MQNRIIEWSHEDQFASANLNRVELFEINGKRTLTLKGSHELPSQVSCISCNTQRGIVAVGQQSGNVSFVYGDTSAGVLVYDSSAARRPCTAVSWNKLNSTQLAAGFEKSRSQGEFCAVVWDVESSSGSATKILYRPLSEEPTASICWLDAHVLVVGTSISWVRLYDVRISAGQQGQGQGQGQGGEIMSIMAHAATRPRKVKGIRCDQLQQHVVATFSDSPGEPIKIWDLRKAGASAKPKLMIVQSQVAAVVDVAWSAARAGVLAVATNQSRNINFYSTVRPVTELISRTPFHTITVADPVKSLSWKMASIGTSTVSINTTNTDTGVHGFSHSNLIGSSTDMRESRKEMLRSNRLLIATTGGFADINVIESVGLGQGAEGCVAVGAGRHVDIMNTTTWGLDSSSDMEALTSSRCTSGYSIDAGKNLQVLADEMDALLVAKKKESIKSQVSVSPSSLPLEISLPIIDLLLTTAGSGSASGSVSMDKNVLPPPHPQSTLDSSEYYSQKDSSEGTLFTPISTTTSTSPPVSIIASSTQSRLLALFRLWAWVDRVENLGNESMSVSFCGVINLLTSSTQTTECSIHSELGVPVYFSENRDLAKQLCGWTRMQQNEDLSHTLKGHTVIAQTNKLRIPERSKSRATSSDYSHDSHLSTGNKSLGSSNDEMGNDSGSPSEQGMKEGMRGSLHRGGKMKTDKDKDSLATSSIGYDIQSELEELVGEVEMDDCFARAAAIALFHGNLTLSVKVLQRHIPLLSEGEGERERYDRSGGSPLITPHSKGNMDTSTIIPTTERNSTERNSTERNNFPVDTDSADNSEGEGESNVNAGSRANHTATGTIEGPIKYDAQYTQLISLTAMCIAGFCYNKSTSSSSSSGRRAVPQLTPQQKMWASMCRHVVTQLELQTEIGDAQCTTSCCYLAAALRFLLETIHSTDTDIISPDITDKKPTRRGDIADVSTGAVKYGCVISDDRLSLEDRVSFALTYLDDQRTLEWLKDIKDDCTVRGDLGGLVVTGLSSEGLDLLQQYLDRHDDLQTVALLVGRNVIDNVVADIATANATDGTSSSGSGSGSGSNSGSSPSPLVRSREWQWLWEYRNLLNRMQLFLGRASLDVQLGRRNRSMLRPGLIVSTGVSGSGDQSAVIRVPAGQGKLRQPLASNTAGRGSGSAIDRKSGSARVLYQLPPHSDLTHVFLRCNYCSSSLPVDPMQQQQAAFFRKQRSLINCCANCKKPLPRCYVCLLYMGLVNPTHEFNRALVQKRKASAELALLSNNSRGNGNTDTTNTAVTVITTHTHTEDTPHNVLAFGQWFFFCQHCKHGGHAACIDDWFEGEDKDRDRERERDRQYGREVCGVNGCFCRCRSLK